jgi:hypothetical protein
MLRTVGPEAATRRVRSPLDRCSESARTAEGRLETFVSRYLPHAAATAPSAGAEQTEAANVGVTMMTTEPMTTRGAHYTALLEIMDHHGAGKLHAKEREQLLAAADALLFGEPESERFVRAAEALIESLETSERWSAESCDQLREHLYGCDGPSGGS